MSLAAPRAALLSSLRSGRGAVGVALLALVAPILGGAGASAQEPLFTFVQTSDSQAGSEAEWRGFEDVMALIARAGQPGALLPRKIDLVLFAGDITLNNATTEWTRARGILDTWLTANGIPFLAVPGNHDVSGTSTTRYQQFIASSGVWDVSSASFTGQNGITRNIGWPGLRIIGFNNSNGAWNQISSTDLTLIQSRVTAAVAAGENILLLCHHPHDEKARTPLKSVLSQRAIVGYLHGHLGTPFATKGLAGITNASVWNLNTNAIVNDRDLIYCEVFPTEIRAHVVVLDSNPTKLPLPKILALPFPLGSPIAVGVGFRDSSHAGARPWPSGAAPEKKLWVQGGNWFGVLWHEASLSYHIFRLDTFAQSWVDTGTSVTASASRSFDALADGTKLYLASHVQSVPSAPGAGSPGQILRYSYDGVARSYTLDAGFPVAINDARTETLSLARDTTGTLWATWTEGGEVRVNHSIGGNDALWSAPALLPFAEADGLDPEDVSALVAFDGKVGLLWSNRVAGEIACALRDDGAAESAWLRESALAAPGAVRDALDVTTSGGRLFVATRKSDGAIQLLVRALGSAGLGSWSAHTVADATAGLDRPIVLVDTTQSLVRVFATGATPAGASALGGGAVYEKDAALATLAFPPGKGTVVLQDGSSPALDRVSSTRQPVSAPSGLALVASNESTQRGWHAFDSLARAPVAPTADFAGQPRSGAAPLLVHFSDLSTGAPTDWRWDFGDGTVSQSASPDHVYAQPGTYAVSLSSSNGAGSDLLARTAYVTVSVAPSVATLKPIADARISEASKSTNSGKDTTLRARSQAGSSYRSFLKFDLAGVQGSVTSAKLRLFVTDSSENGGSLYSVASTWTETGVTWNNQPALPASSVASLGAVTSSAWKEVDVTAAVTGTGQVSLALAGGNTNLAQYSSREGSSPPELVVTFSSTPETPVTDFSAQPTTGSAPLSVAFSDLSTGTPTSWLWNFGDGTTATQKSPSHVYTQPGNYTVTLTASNTAGSNTRTRAAFVTVLASAGSVTFHPTADTRVNEASQATNYGTDIVLRMKTQPGTSYRTFLKFDLAALGATPTSATLRLFVTDESNSGGSVFLVPSTWTETGITWANQPSLPSSSLSTAGAAPLGTWVEFDVGSAVLGPGTVSFAIAGGTTNSVFYSSREGANPPELVVRTASP